MYFSLFFGYLHCFSQFCPLLLDIPNLKIFENFLLSEISFHSYQKSNERNYLHSQSVLIKILIVYKQNQVSLCSYDSFAIDNVTVETFIRQPRQYPLI